MFEGKKLAIIGAGKMGEALLKGFISTKVLDKSQIIIADIDEQRLRLLNSQYNVSSTSNNYEAIKQSDIIVLAIKPQQMDKIISEVKGSFDDKKIVISIAAGITTEKLYNLIDRNLPIIRVMPNTPALIGKGMSVISKGRHADEYSLEISKALFRSVGEVLELDEKDINAVTAISGSGPAYFFLLVEALIDSAKAVGLDDFVAKKLAIQTFIGSAKLLEESSKDPSELREMVTSPGGTTAAALQVFSNREFRFIVQEAVNAAINRANELAKMEEN